MRAVRFGSYSTLAAFAGTPNLSRRKSMRRYCRLCPPPIYRLVMWPLFFRPPLRARGSRRERSGSVLVIDPQADTQRDLARRVTRFDCKIALSVLELPQR